MSDEIRYTGREFICPNCGAKIAEYRETCWRTPCGKEYTKTRPNEDSDEDNDVFIIKKLAGCIRCLDCWETKDLMQRTGFVFR